MVVTFSRVLGTRHQSAVVLALADGYRVRWTPARGWTCACCEADHPTCPHIPAVRVLIDPRITQPAPEGDQHQ